MCYEWFFSLFPVAFIGSLSTSVSKMQKKTTQTVRQIFDAICFGAATCFVFFFPPSNRLLCHKLKPLMFIVLLLFPNPTIACVKSYEFFGSCLIESITHFAANTQHTHNPIRTKNNGNTSTSSNHSNTWIEQPNMEFLCRFALASAKQRMDLPDKHWMLSVCITIAGERFLFLFSLLLPFRDIEWKWK